MDRNIDEHNLKIRPFIIMYRQRFRLHKQLQRGNDDDDNDNNIESVRKPSRAKNPKYNGISTLIRKYYIAYGMQ